MNIPVKTFMCHNLKGILTYYYDFEYNAPFNFALIALDIIFYDYKKVS